MSLICTGAIRIHDMIEVFIYSKFEHSRQTHAEDLRVSALQANLLGLNQLLTVTVRESDSKIRSFRIDFSH